MANINEIKGVIGILTGGGDVPGLNPEIRGVAVRAIREGYKVIGIRRGWGGMIDIVRDKNADNSNNYIELTEEVVAKAACTGGTFLHTSRTNPSKVAKEDLPEQYRDKYTDDVNDLTEEVLKNLDFLNIDVMIRSGATIHLATVYGSTKRASRLWLYPKPWIMTFLVQTTVSDSAPVFHEPYSLRTISGRRPVLTRDFL